MIRAVCLVFTVAGVVGCAAGGTTITGDMAVDRAVEPIPDTAPPDAAAEGIDSRVDSADVRPDLRPDLLPDTLADAICSGNHECDDELACTTDICGVDGCANIITGNFCVIEDSCVAGGMINPANICQICQPGMLPDGWSSAAETGCDDNDPCTHGDRCEDSQCIGSSYSCDDGLDCTIDQCTGSGPDGCVFTLDPGFCTIDGVCVVGGASDPNATCRICAPAASTSQWTQQPGFCLIDETCYLEGAANSLNPCEVCKTTTNADAWTVLPGTDPSPHKIIVTEIMADPQAVSDTAGEWIELYNAGAVAVDLDGWTLRDDGTDSHRIAGSLVIPPETYVVLGRNSDHSANGGATVSYRYQGFVLANAEDEIVLIDDSCREVDRIAYDSSWPTTAGVSLQVTDPGADNADPANWCLAGTSWSTSTGDVGTPGMPTICASEVDAGVDSGLDAGVDAADAASDAAVDAAIDTGVDSSPDAGNVVVCGSSPVHFFEVAVGLNDFVALRNYGTGPVDIVGYQLLMYGAGPTPLLYVIKASDMSGPLAAGATVYLFEYNNGGLPGDINTGENIPFYNGPPLAAKANSGLLFDAAGHLIDFAAVGENIGKPDNVTFTAVPWPATFDSAVSSFQRVGNNGSCPNFSYFDWYYGPLTR